jgi:hypothetical protein
VDLAEVVGLVSEGRVADDAAELRGNRSRLLKLDIYYILMRLIIFKAQSSSIFLKI